MKVKEFFTYCKNAHYSNLELMISNETFLLDQFIKSAEKSINYDERLVFFGQETEISRILAECSQQDLFAVNKLIIIKEFNQLTWDEESIDQFLKLTDDASPGFSLIMLADSSKGIPKSIKKRIEERGNILEIGQVYQNEAADYLNLVLNKMELSATPDAKEELLKYIGPDLQELQNQLEKIKLYLGTEKKEIQKTDIEAVVGFTSHYSVFQLIDAIISGNAESSLQISSAMTESGQHPLLPLSMLTRQFIQLSHYIKMKQLNVDSRQLKEIFKLRDFQLKKLESYRLRLSENKIGQILSVLKKADHELKMRSIPQTQLSVLFSRTIMEIIQICKNVKRES
ncbi:MAG: DNA polymerase III subunit delta [Calditrichia bacterium]